MSTLSSTAYGAAFLRAVEDLLPSGSRIINDPISGKLLPAMYRLTLTIMRNPALWKLLVRMREKSTPGIVGGIICRTRYSDDLLIDAIREGIDTVVNLGAGMDSRPFRIPGIENILYFELDLPEVMKFKKSIVTRKLGGIPHNLSLVPVDFSSQEPGEEWKKAGYNPSSRTFFIWEGVTQYLPGEAIDKTLKYVAGAASGSKIVFTYVLDSCINGSNIPEGLDFLYKYMIKKKNPIWLSGLDHAGINGYLSERSLSLIEDIGHEECMERYIKPAGRDLTVMEIERAVLAEVK